MATINRIGTGALWIGSLALASLMAYTLLLADSRTRGLPTTGVDDVAIVFPEQSNTAWEEFRQGVLACRDLGLIDNVLDARTALTVRTRGGNRLRFVWSPASGMVQTRQLVRELLARPVPPVAVVGSENTALTAVLAEALRDHPLLERAESGGPVLLVPWATAVVAQPATPGSTPVPLLEIHPGRTFRICPDNTRQAELLVRYALHENAGQPPARSIVVSDRDDPFSRDLAQALREALRNAVPGSPIDDQEALPVPAMPSAALELSENQWAERAWSQARAGADRGPTWLVLPLQGEPTRRLLNALATLAPRDAEQVPLRVLCGDGIGMGTLTELAGTLPMPVWVASPGFVNANGPPLPQGVQVMAEVVLSVARARDAVGPAGDLAAGLRTLRIPPEALGRSIAFRPNGERSGEDLGQILAIRPGSDRVTARQRRSDGGWSEPRPVAPERP